MSDAWYAKLVLRRPLVPLAAAALAGAAALTILPGFRVEAQGDSLTLGSDPDRAAYDRVRGLFGGDDEILIGIEPDEPWSPETIARIEALTADLEVLSTVTVPFFDEAPGIDRVASPTRLRLFRSLPAGTPAFFAVRPVTLAGGNADLDRAREELTTSALAGDALVARDGSAFAVALRLAPYDPAPASAASRWVDPVRDARRARLRAVVAAVRETAARHQAPGFTLHVSGVPAIVVDMVSALERDMLRFGALAAVTMALLLVLALRRAAWVVLPFATVALLVAIVLAGTVLAGRSATVVTANASALLVVIGLAHAIHLAVRLSRVAERFPAAPLREKVRRAVREVARPCLYAALTTAIGFGSIAVSDIRPNVDFGVSMAIGALLAWVLTFAVIPPALVLLPEARAVPPAAGPGHRLLDRLSRKTLAHPAVIAAASLLLAAVALAGVVRLDVESRLTDHFREGDPIARGLAFVDARLGGTVPVEIVLESAEAGAFRTSRGIEAVRGAHERLDAIPEIGAVSSLEAVRRDGAAAVASLAPIGGGDVPFERLLSMSESLLGADRVRALVDPYVDPTWSVARISARVHETAPGLDRRALLGRIRGIAADIAADSGMRADVTGLFVLYANMLASLGRSTLNSSLAVVAALLFMLALLFRSVRVGALALVPNLLPVLVVLGVMGLAGTPLDMMSIMTVSVTLGLAVDASIHLTFGYLEERRAGSDRDAAVVAACRGIGRAIMHTSLIVSGGFLVLLLSRFVPTARFGALTSLALLASLAASLVLLPVLLRHASGR